MLSSPTVVARPAVDWRIAPPAPPSEVERLVRELGIPPLLAAMLWNRGIRENVREQLKPTLRPTTIPDLELAAERLEYALRERRRILIHGDYDADGISGTAVLLLGLRSLGANVEAFIPDRLGDGYGISPERIEEHASRCELFLTVDCGISNVDEVARLTSAGVEVIVSDHHTPGETLPEALLVHPAMSPHSGKGPAELTGAGVAYHLLWALHRRLGLEDPLEFSDLATIGTIADVAPLLGENRALVQAGLERMANSRWPGLRAAVAQSGLRGAVTARDVAFVLAPRLNAAGRLGEADKGLELLTTGSERRARELAAYLDARNEDRRKIQDEMFEHALRKVDADAPALVLDDDDWHPGVMGIVASKLLEHFYKPVFIIAKGKGSVRSTPGISAVGALRHAGNYLRRFGGHPQAAGFAIDAGEIGRFRGAVCEYVRRHPTPVPAIAADAVVSAVDVDTELYRAIAELEPYGEGHPSPVLALCDRLETARAVGRDGGTLQIRVAGLKGVAWRKGELARELRPGTFVNAAVSLREQEWQGKRSLEFVAQELRPLEPFRLGAAVPPEVERRRAQIRRGRSREAVLLDTLETIPSGARSYCVRTLDSSDPLAATEVLRSLLEADSALYFDLDERELARAAQATARLPGVASVRQAFVALQRGGNLPFPPPTARLVRQILEELDLLDERGRVRRGEKRDPYTSTTLVRSLMERYRLGTLLNAYRTCDDEGFAVAAARVLVG